MFFGIEVIILLTFLTTQLLLAAFAAGRKLGVSQRFLDPLGSQTTLAELLEKFSRIYGTFNVSVNALRKRIVDFSGDTLLVNRELVHQVNLYYLLVGVWYLAGVHGLWRRFQNYKRLQVAMFVLELILAGLGLLNVLFFTAAAIVAIFLVVVSFAVEAAYETWFERVEDIATDLLELDAYEQKRMQSLLSYWRGNGFIYVFVPLFAFLRFLGLVRE